MTVTKYLNQIAILDGSIQRREMLLQEARELAYAQGGSIDYSKERVDTSPSNNQMDKIIDLVDSAAELREELTKLHSLKRQILGRIERVSDERYHKLLWLKYVELHSLEQISREMQYTYEYVRRLHIEALNSFAEVNQDIVNMSQNITDNN